VIVSLFIENDGKSIAMRQRFRCLGLRSRSNSRFGRILVITGARQTGKTTLVKELFNDYSYVSIEDPVVVDEFKKLSASQWKSLYPQAILDEVQKEPQLVESIKAVYDQYPEPKYILLGSSQILLMQKIRESIAGRSDIIEMYPLCLPELLTQSWDDSIQYSYFQQILLGNTPSNNPFLLDPLHARKKQVYDTFLKFGGYPAISDEDISDKEKYSWLKNYVSTYLERDIRDLAEIRNLHPFKKVQKILAIQTGQLVNFSQLALDASVTSKTTQRFLEYMNISYQTLSLQAWNRNAKKRLVKSQKVHYMDVGVMRAILQKRDMLNGHEFESAIVSEIYKQAKSVDAEVSFYHLRTSDGREVDLLIEMEKGYIAIEVKMGEKMRAVDGKHLRGLEAILDKPILHRFVLSNDLSLQELEEGILAVPAVQFLT